MPTQNLHKANVSVTMNDPLKNTLAEAWKKLETRQLIYINGSPPQEWQGYTHAIISVRSFEHNCFGRLYEKCSFDGHNHGQHLVIKLTMAGRKGEYIIIKRKNIISILMR